MIPPLILHYRPPTAVRMSTDSRVDIESLKQSCLVINTADYCQTTALEVVLLIVTFSPPSLTRSCSSSRSIARRLTANSKKKSASKLNAIYSSGLFFLPRATLPSPNVFLLFSSISTAIAALLREFEAACDPCFTTMSRSIWSSVNQVSGQSPYSDDLVKAAEQVVELIKPLIEQKKYLRNFFDKACR